MRSDLPSPFAATAVTALTMAAFAVGFLLLAVRFHEVQVESAALYAEGMSRQSVSRVLTTGARGRILDRHGRVLAENRRSRTIVCDAAAFQRRTWDATAEAMAAAIAELGGEIGLESPLDAAAIAARLRREVSLPLEVWRDIGFRELARFSERQYRHPGFRVETTSVREYPHGALAAHVLGYVGRDRGEGAAGDENFRFREFELRGRAGLESHYDEFLRGVSGEKRLRVDVRGFTVEERTVTPVQAGPDLVLALDLELQRTVERELGGLKGACVVLDPRDGSVLAMASAPAYDLSRFSPTIDAGFYASLRDDPAKPLVNRAAAGVYAPGSTFKPITALAALESGQSPDTAYECCGVFSLGGMNLRCSRRWGHGEIDLVHALKVSCNPYFCNLGMMTGTNLLMTAAHGFALGSRTGLDLPVDAAGVVPDHDWKMLRYHERWYPGDLAQMSIGQGMLLVSPLQMARVAGALGTGYLVTPHLKAEVQPRREKLAFSRTSLAAVRRGMYEVVNGVDEYGHLDGSGRLAGENLAVRICGKTGTAEVGVGATRRKNTWFIAYAPAVNPTVAVALVVENGASGGSTAAPRVRNVLAAIFGEAEGGGG